MKPLFLEKEKTLLKNYIDSDGYYTEFENTDIFENNLAEIVKAKNIIAVNNGTLSLIAILYSLGLSPGDEFIAPNFTMAATITAGMLLGLRPKLVDVEFPSLYLDINKLEDNINSRTRAVILVNANGRYPSYNVDELFKFLSKKGIYLIEDSAQGLGSFYPDGTHLGLKSDAGSISFSMPKVITTGQGGVILTNSEELNRKLRSFKNFGRSGSGLDSHPDFGINLKFTELQALMGIGQLEDLPNRIEKKKIIYKWYRDALQELDPYFGFILENDINYTSPWFYEFICRDRSQLLKFLSENGVGTREMYPPLNSQKFLLKKLPDSDKIDDYKVSTDIGDRGLWLPSYVQITQDEVAEVAHLIRSFYSRY